MWTREQPGWLCPFDAVFLHPGALYLLPSISLSPGYKMSLSHSFPLSIICSPFVVFPRFQHLSAPSIFTITVSRLGWVLACSRPRLTLSAATIGAGLSFALSHKLYIPPYNSFLAALLPADCVYLNWNVRRRRAGRSVAAAPPRRSAGCFFFISGAPRSH